MKVVTQFSVAILFILLSKSMDAQTYEFTKISSGGSKSLTQIKDGYSAKIGIGTNGPTAKLHVQFMPHGDTASMRIDALPSTISNDPFGSVESWLF